MRPLGHLLRVLPDYARTAFWALTDALGGRRSGSAPRIVVQGVVTGPEGVLLAVRVDLRGWELPGGNPDPGESESAALAREIAEETGLRVEVGALSGTYHRSGFLAHTARVYRCHVVGGVLRPSDETPCVAWFDPEALPRTIFPWHRRPLDDALRGRAAAPVERHEHQGLAAIWAGARIDLRMRLSNDAAR